MDRVQKIMSNNGYCSRRKAEELIKQGKVKVNGKVIQIGDKATEKDKITVNGKPLKTARKAYILFNKPMGCVTALKDDKYKTVMDFIKLKERVFPIGRLDYNTTGLLLLTNDGDFANQIMHPRYEITKTYLAKIERPMNIGDAKQIEKGITLEDGKTSPAKVRIYENNLVEITIHEGKNRIVRRILNAMDYKVLTLKRTRIGLLDLGTLRSGKFRHLKENDKVRIFCRSKKELPSKRTNKK